jgi:alpha-beta hydrolase superfamily lysophospholipase
VTARSHAWADASVWTGRGVRREAWFFDSRGERLFASLYAPADGRPTDGVVVCPSWGWEMVQQHELCHALALGLAHAGVEAIVYHPPGHGDSGGDPGRLTLDALIEAAVDAVSSADDRGPGLSWGLVGVRLGAAVAVLATVRRPAGALLLVQPSLDPAAFFDEMLAAGRRGASIRQDGADAPGARVVMGDPLPDALLASARDRDSARALAAFPGRALVVRCARPVPAAVPEHVPTVTLPDAWRPVVRPRHAEAVVSAVLDAVATRCGSP